MISFGLRRPIAALTLYSNRAVFSDTTPLSNIDLTGPPPQKNNKTGKSTLNRIRHSHPINVALGRIHQ